MTTRRQSARSRLERLGLLPLLLLSQGVAGLDAKKASVLEHHNAPTRDGVYVDPHFTRAALPRLHRDRTFAATLEGPTYAQPLYLADSSGVRDLVFAFTEQNRAYAFEASSGRLAWEKVVAAPVSRRSLPCGNIDPVGITGTPVIDPKTRTLYLAAMTTPDRGKTKRHLVFALSADSGEIRPGWPVDAARAARGTPFEAEVQNQRGALALLAGHVYVPYGGHWGDCGDYHGWVVGVPTSGTEAPSSWSTRAVGGGVWAPSGVASDGESLFIATGNTSEAASWGGGEAIIRLPPTLVFQERSADYFVPRDWKALDNADEDLGGTGPVLFHGPGGAIALGKNGMAYLLNPARLGGIGGALAERKVSSEEIINAAAAYSTPKGTYVVFKGEGLECPARRRGNLTALRIQPGSPAISVAWCADEHGTGSPIVSMADPEGTDAIVWGLGAEGDGRLRGFDADTGAVVFDGGGAGDAMTHISRFQTPIIANGRLFVASDTTLNVFSTN
jgi:hypothetical protein